MADIDMDVDMDIDLGLDPEIAQLEAEAMKIEARSAQIDAQEVSTTAPADNLDELAPTKVHIRGLDNLTTDNIRQFAGEYYSLDNFQRVEWIDDTSANLIYESEQAAQEALIALSDLQDGNVAPLQLRRAKALPSNPDTELFVRQATLADKKAPRAHERSRFYLMNPDHDPRERKGDYDNRRRGPRRDNRQRNDAPKPFDVNMYDDAEEESPALSYDDEDDRRHDRRRDDRPRRPRGGDLFAGKETGRLRDRSASPVRDGDGRYGFSQEQPERRTARRRSVSPPPRKRDLIPAARANNGPIELLPTKSTSKTFGLDAPGTSTSPPKRNRELFPNKSARSNHRRSDALDADETASIRRSLADRITGGPETSGFSIRGSAQADVPGFSIRGASREVNPKVKELFPSKFSNGAEPNDLFADKMRDRNTQRRRAEDMMYSQCVPELQTIPQPIMLFAFAFSSIAIPALPEVQPFRFFDLPIEIRYIVFEQLMDRKVRVKIPHLSYPDCLLDRPAEVIDCFYPAIMRVNKRFKDEYSTVVMPQMMLCAEWRSFGLHQPLERVQAEESTRPDLPEIVLAQLRYLDLFIILGYPRPHCDLHSTFQALTSRMSQLTWVYFTTGFGLEKFYELAYSSEIKNHLSWKHEMVHFLQGVVNNKPSWTVMATFNIFCDLFCPCLTIADARCYDWANADIPVVSFAICSHPDEDTFKLEGSDLKFMGFGGQYADEDSNTQLTLTAR
ncbi:hypothetical protein KCU81_g2798, partial [Aureobasidium melanogenum]